MTDLGERFEVIVRDAVPSGPATAVNGAAANGTAHHGAADHGAADHGAADHGADSTSVVPSATAGSGPVPAGAAGQDAVSAGVPGGSDGFAGQDGSAVPSSTTVPSSTAVPSDVFISGFGLAVISGLADDVRVSATASGVSVRMTWPAALSTRA